MVKLTKQQVEIVAQKVKEQVEKSQKTTIEQDIVVDDYLKVKNQLEKAAEAISKQKKELDSAFEKKHKITLNYYTKTRTEILNAFKKRVNVTDIQNEIVLNSIFDKSEDLESFIQKLVKKFS